ncbi:MAG: DNA repair protein RecO, partial [Tepidisphaeraceae bacterium]
IHRDRAICLRKYDYSETSQILTLFGRQSGIVRVIAKGAHRRTKAGASKFDGGVDLLDIGDCVYIDRERELSTLTEWKLLSGNLTLRRSLRGVILGQSIAEIITLLLAERDPHPAMFDRLRVTLPRLGGEQGQELFLSLLIDVIEMTGFLPDLVSDSPGGQRADAGLWRIAETMRRLPRERGLPIRLPRLTRRQTDPLIAALFDHIGQVVQRPIWTREFVLG